MADGFLGRWSRRKAGKEDDVLEKKVQAPQDATQDLPVQSIPEEVPAPATLEDVAKIDRFDPDFSAFMKPDVDPAVQQAALKKMFTDPHFNIMDGLDIYIDDYSKPDPLPPGMLERMVQSDMLNLFSKSSDATVQGPEQVQVQAQNLQLESDALDDQKQSDLTSTQKISSTPLDEVSNEASIEALNETSIEPEQKKT